MARTPPDANLVAARMRVAEAIRNDRAVAATDSSVAAQLLAKLLWPSWKVAVIFVSSVLWIALLLRTLDRAHITTRDMLAAAAAVVLLLANAFIVRQQLRLRSWSRRHPPQ